IKLWVRDNQEVREEAMDAILAEAKRMKSLTHQMLDLARDDTHERMQFQQVDLEQLCRETVRPLIRTTGRPIEVVMEEAEAVTAWGDRSEEHTSELQSRENLVCRLLLEKKK